MRQLRSGFLAIIAVLVTAMVAFGLELPDKPTTRVNDYAGLLDAATRQALEAELAQFETRTSNQIVVATFPSLEEESLEDYTVRLFDKWNLGQQGRNNGALLVVFLADKKIRIEVGYGLEGVLTDALSSRIIRNEMAPAFLAGNPAQGIIQGVRAIEQATQGEYKGVDRPVARRKEPLGIVPIVLFIIIMIVVSSAQRRGGGPVVVGPRGARRARHDDWWGGSGGGWGGGFGGGGGGGWGGGGGGGGGFSGGGGSSGGGGASGGW